MKLIEEAANTSRLELLTLFELTSRAHELSVKLGLTHLSETLHDAKRIVSKATTIEEFIGLENPVNAKTPVKH